MLRYVRILEKGIIFILIAIITIILLFATADVVITIAKKFFEPPYFVQAENLMELFSLFLVILIGIELLETVKAFLKENMVHVEIVVLVAIIAIARKVIIWDSAKQSNNDLIPYAAMLLGLAITYFIIKYSDRNGHLPWKSKENRRPYRGPQQPKQENKGRLTANN